MTELVRVRHGKVYSTITLKVRRSDLCEGFLPDGDVDKKSATKKTKKKKAKTEFSDDPEILAVNLSKAYNKAKKKYHKNKNIVLITPNQPAFEHFRKAVSNILLPHNIKNLSRFIKCQIDGLGFVDGGRGKFPMPNQIHGPGAENRYLEFYNKQSKHSKQADLLDSKVRLTKEEEETPLSDNTRYQHRTILVKDGYSSDIETIYVAKLQVIRRGKIEKWVKSRLKVLGIKWQK